MDGIIGLAGRHVSDTGAPTPLDDLVSQGHMEDIFGLCLAKDGGQMYLGGNASELVEHATAGQMEDMAGVRVRVVVGSG